jgi:hypothetical protein
MLPNYLLLYIHPKADSSPVLGVSRSNSLEGAKPYADCLFFLW